MPHLDRVGVRHPERRDVARRRALLLLLLRRWRRRQRLHAARRRVAVLVVRQLVAVHGRAVRGVRRGPLLELVLVAGPRLRPERRRVRAELRAARLRRVRRLRLLRRAAVVATGGGRGRRVGVLDRAELVDDAAQRRVRIQVLVGELHVGLVRPRGDARLAAVVDVRGDGRALVCEAVVGDDGVLHGGVLGRRLVNRLDARLDGLDLPLQRVALGDERLRLAVDGGRVGLRRLEQLLQTRDGGGGLHGVRLGAGKGRRGVRGCGAGRHLKGKT
mmetsp:Transcript_47057/g.145090  ORF Transcript_47057/g.145090 Transcript_47057/m.145090 type:complete len:273 (-) Transcript_47057:110-928(-)